jgi:hypothetical protein
MIRLSRSQKEFLDSQNISESKVFDATGIPTKIWKKILVDEGYELAIGVTKCQKQGHGIRNRHGKCAVCTPLNKVFSDRYHDSAYVYIAESKSANMIKIGFSNRPDSRINDIRYEGYGGVKDWTLTKKFKSVKAGKLENRIHQRLATFSDPRPYLKDGKSKDGKEIFNCTVEVATNVINSLLEENDFGSHGPSSIKNAESDNCKAPPLPIGLSEQEQSVPENICHVKNNKQISTKLKADKKLTKHQKQAEARRLVIRKKREKFLLNTKQETRNFNLRNEEVTSKENRNAVTQPELMVNAPSTKEPASANTNKELDRTDIKTLSPKQPSTDKPHTKPANNSASRNIKLALLFAALLIGLKFVHYQAIETGTHNTKRQYSSNEISDQLISSRNDIILSKEDLIEEIRDYIFEKSYSILEARYLVTKKEITFEERANLLILSHHATDCLITTLREQSITPDILRQRSILEWYIDELIEQNQNKCLKH